MQPNTEVINQWTESARYWEKYRDTIGSMFAPVTQALVEDAAIARDASVLDVATGPGEPALSIAERIRSAGKVVGTDPILEMVEAARREARRRGLQNASFEVAFADNLPFPGNSFDAVVSRFGVMFFASPQHSVREWLRVLKPEGRMAVAVWHFAEKNPFFNVITQVVEKYVASPPPAPDSPDAFRFATPGKLKTILSETGVTATSERLLQFPVQAALSVEQFWTVRSEMSDKLRTKLATLSNEQREALKRDVLEAIRPYSSERGVNFPAEVLIVSGRKQSL